MSEAEGFFGEYLSRIFVELYELMGDDYVACLNDSKLPNGEEAIIEADNCRYTYRGYEVFPE